MASYDDDNDPTAGSQDEDENDDEEMEDVNEADQDGDQDMDGGGDDDEDEGGDDDEDDDNENDDEEGDDQNETDSPTRRASQATHTARSAGGDGQQSHPAVVLTSPSPRVSAARSPGAGIVQSYIPPTRPEALTAQAYDIVPTMAAPQSTSINAIAATPDMRWVFSGGTDGYVRMFNWVETANGKVPLTVAQKHPFVDSVMKAGSLLTYWENEEATLHTPPKNADEGKWTSPVYSLAVHHQALWLLSGLESGGINLQTCRHQAGTRITTLKEHTSAVSVLQLSQDETQLLSGSWDKNIFDWDLQTGKVKRSFKGSGSQISAIETRPISDLPIPEITEIKPESSTFSSNNADKPGLNGFSNGPSRRPSGLGGDEDAIGSPDGSLFGEGDHGSLFGDDTGGGGGGAGNTFDDDDDLTRALESEMADPDQDGATNADADMGGMGSGGPVQALEDVDPSNPAPELAEAATASTSQQPNGQTDGPDASAQADHATLDRPDPIVTNGLPHSDEPLTAPPTNDETKPDLPPQSESTFLDTSIDGTIRIWDRRMAASVATIAPWNNTPPWATGACWSPDGNTFYVGRRNCTVDEYSIHNLNSEPARTFRFQQGSGPVYAVRSMPNRKHLVCASQDILRIYDLQQPEATKHSRVPFTIVPGHRGGVISAIHVDPSCRFMLSAAGNRGWEGSGTEVLLGYEIGVQDEKGIWHK